MSNKNANIATPQVEKGAAKSEESTKVIQMETPLSTVSQKLARGAIFSKMSKDIDLMYAQRERFNVLFFGTGDAEPQEIATVYLRPKNADSNYLKESEMFKVKNPETILKIRGIIATDLATMIEELETKIVNF